ncbi:MAG: glutaredoxin [Gammaproteobacteria bacterium]|nr:glutaredoxin [Gammaproteobacteria bacterium]
MVTSEHTCPYGLKAKYWLERKGFRVVDNHLTTREETDAFKAQYNVKTTPQIFIDGERIGGYDDLREHLGDAVKSSGETSYRPVITLFLMTFLIAVAASWKVTQQWFGLQTLEWFVAFSMCLLAYLKIRDVENFSSMFLNYDLLAKKWVPYGYIYPYAEGAAGLLMITGSLNYIAVPIALFIGTVGAISVFKAVYLDKRELKCACVGGDSNVPLGFISLTENLLMIVMALWMLVKPSVI